MIQNEIKLLSLAAAILPDWFGENAADLPWRKERTPYRTWISEIMLQQTRKGAVIPYFERFMQTFPNVFALAAADEEQLLKLWEGLGYYSRARNLHRAAKQIANEYGGEFPHTAKELRALSGVGEYTAGAIASVCFGEREPAVDGNVLRVVMRYLGSDMDISLPATKRAVTEALRTVYPSGERAGRFTEALMELGEQICIPNGEPRCLCCPLSEHCVALRENTRLSLPNKSPKKARRSRPCTVFLLQSGDKYAILKRPSTGLLAGLWELPNVDGTLTPEEARHYAASLSPAAVSPLGEATHIFTHIEWHMIGYRIECHTPNSHFTWATASEIQSTYAVPKAFRFYVEKMQ